MAQGILTLKSITTLLGAVFMIFSIMSYIQIQQRYYYLHKINSELGSIYNRLGNHSSTHSTTAIMTTGTPTTSVHTTGIPTTSVPTTAILTTAMVTTGIATTLAPTTAIPTTAIPTTAIATTGAVIPFAPLVFFDYFGSSNMTYCSGNYGESSNCTVVFSCNFESTTFVNYYSAISGSLIRQLTNKNASTYFSLTSDGYTYIPSLVSNWTILVFAPGSSVAVIVPVSVPIGIPIALVTQVKSSNDGHLWATSGIGLNNVVVVFNVSGTSIVFNRLYYQSIGSMFNPVDIQFDSLYVYIADQGDSAILRSLSLASVASWTSWTGAFMGLTRLTIYQTNFVTDTSGYLLLYSNFLTSVTQNIGLFANNSGAFTFGVDGILYIQDIVSQTGFYRYRPTNFMSSVCTFFSTTGISLTTSNPTTGVATTGVSCTSGLTFCPGFGCVSLASNPMFCGSCSYNCSQNLTNVASSQCLIGTCSNLVCNTPFGHCSTNISTGCETNLNNNTNFCGSCSINCSTIPGVNITTTQCVSSLCSYNCSTIGFINCGLAILGCNVNSLTDSNNCGSCGRVCPGGDSCISGVCTSKKKRKEEDDFFVIQLQ